VTHPTVWPQYTNVTDRQTGQRVAQKLSSVTVTKKDKSSAMAERWATVATIDMGLKEGVLCPFRGVLGTSLIQCGLRRGLLTYQVASSSIQPFDHNSVGCHSPRRNISTNYYLVVEMHTITVRSALR